MNEVDSQDDVFTEGSDFVEVVSEFSVSDSEREVVLP